MIGITNPENAACSSVKRDAVETSLIAKDSESPELTFSTVERSSKLKCDSEGATGLSEDQKSTIIALFVSYLLEHCNYL